MSINLRRLWSFLASSGLGISCFSPCGIANDNSGIQVRHAYFGDLHLHTSYSFDAYLIGATKVDPDLAYRFAKGETITYLGESVHRRSPLDFLAVTDHSENIGVLAALDDNQSAFAKSDAGKQITKMLAPLAIIAGVRDLRGAVGENSLWHDYFAGRKDKAPEVAKSASRAAWAREIESANRNYEPGKFTTFIGYEWSAQTDASNLHRNVIFRGASAPYPFTSLDSKDPQALWTWLDALRKQGIEAMAIPHNGNASNGLMYDWVTNYIDQADASQRQANEPLTEISQSKGQSETHPLLSPNDEFANFEIFDFLEVYRLQVGRLQGSYVRDALGAGLSVQRRVGENPFKYGFVGGSDLHSGLSVSAQEDFDGSHWTANLGGGRMSKEEVEHGLDEKAGNPVSIQLKGTSGNLTGVWAEENSREAIYGALRRRETFATTGSKLTIRFFGGWVFSGEMLRRSDWVSRAYATGVPMGSDLPNKPAGARQPMFAISVLKDPDGPNLDRAQIVKVWDENGDHKEKIYDVVSSGAGAVRLEQLWKDPDFKADQLAAYYLRVLEVSTPRWSTMLTQKFGLPVPDGVPALVQQRGWSSPIWYSPAGTSLDAG